MNILATTLLALTTANSRKIQIGFQTSKSSFSYAIDGCGDDIRQHQATDRRIHPKRCHRPPITTYQNNRDEAQAERPQIQVDLYIAIVRFV